MDNDNLRGLTVSGTINSEFTIDGSSNVVSGARVAIQPPAEAIQEFKVETAVYDAQIGHTGAGNVNLALKSGTNTLHGAASYYNRDDSRSEPLFASERLGGGVTPRDYNRFSAMLSGPIFKNKTFFMGSYERLQDDTIETVHELGAHGEDAQRRLLGAARRRRADLQPLLRAAGQRRSPSAIRSRATSFRARLINPIARNVLALYPAPNQARHVGPAQQLLLPSSPGPTATILDGPRRPRVDARTTRPTCATSRTSGARSVTISPASSDHPGLDRPLQPQCGGGSHGDPVAHARPRPEGQLAASSTTT